MNKIPFNVPTSTSKEVPHLIEAVKSKKLSGDGPFGKKCEKWFERNLELDRYILLQVVHMH